MSAIRLAGCLLLAVVLGLLGCPTAGPGDVDVGDDDDDAAPDDDDSAADDDDSAADDDDDDCPEPYEAEACAELFCGPPTVEVGTGTDGFEPLKEGTLVPVVYGPQGGYHIDMTAEMTNLCPIVYLEPSVYLDPGDGGELVQLFTQLRHIQALRAEPDKSSLQHFWGIRGFVPCAYWPDDPNHDLECGGGAGSAGRIEDFEVVLKMEAWDHSVGPAGEEQYRYGAGERRVQPYCCAGD